MRKAGNKRKNKIIRLAVFSVLALLCSACLTVFFLIGNMLESQEAAERFQGENETRFAQISAFFPVGEGKVLSDIYSFRESLETSLTEASLEAPEGGSLWIDAYSAHADITIKGSKGSASVSALGIGGDWFAFHPLELGSGSYISEEDLMHDRVVLNEELAWKLFGGFDLAGMEVTIGDVPYIIAGVVTMEDDFASGKAYSGGAGLFMHYDMLNEISESEISCYELVCADPVSGFALDIAQTGFSGAVTLQNSGRYSFSTVLDIILDFGERSMSAEAVALPYWENAARFAEDYAALMLVLAFAFGLYPAIRVLRLIIELVVKFKRKISSEVRARWEKTSDRIRERQRLRLEENQSQNK